MRSGVTAIMDNDGRPTGKHLAWVDLGIGSDGKRQRTQVTVVGLRKAQREHDRLRREAVAGTLVFTDRSTVARLLDLWLSAARETVGAKTYERYEDIVTRHIKPELGSSRLDSIQRNPELIRAFLTNQRDHGGTDGRALAPRTVVHIHRVLRGALQWACDDGKLAKNAAAAPSVRKLARAYASAAREGSERTCLTPEQMQQLVAATRGTLLHLPVVLAVSAGLRRGEILALRWQDVDLQTGTLQVRHSLTQTKAGVAIKAPKSRSSRRSVVLPPFAMAELQAAWDARGLYATPEGFVCMRANGEALIPDSFSADFAGFMRRRTLPLVSFHDLRHSHATWLVGQGLHPKTISARLGHSSAAFTLDTYCNAFADADRAAAAAIDVDYRQLGVNEGSKTGRKRHLRVVR
jgi:integrase